APDFVPEDGGGALGLIEAERGDADVQVLRFDSPAGGVLEAVEEEAQDAEARRDDAAGIPRVHSLGEDVDGEVADDRAAERGGHPELFVVAAAAVEADGEAERAELSG